MVTEGLLDWQRQKMVAQLVGGSPGFAAMAVVVAAEAVRHLDLVAL